MELLERAQEWFNKPMPSGDKTAYFQELNALNYEITGQRVSCTSCIYYSLRNRIESFINQPLSFTNPTIMKSTKYSFTTAASGNKTTIILHLENGATKAVTADNLTDEDAELILNNKSLNEAYGHNIQAIEGGEAESEEEEPTEAELEAARSEFEELTGTKPGNRKYSTLLTAIEEAKAAK